MTIKNTIKNWCIFDLKTFFFTNQPNTYILRNTQGQPFCSSLHALKIACFYKWQHNVTHYFVYIKVLTDITDHSQPLVSHAKYESLNKKWIVFYSFCFILLNLPLSRATHKTIDPIFCHRIALFRGKPCLEHIQEKHEALLTKTPLYVDFDATKIHS